MTTQTKTEPNVQQAVPFFGVTSMEASLRFYVDGLGFVMTKKWTPDGDGKIRWCWVERDGVALMLQEFKKDHHPNSGRPETARGIAAKRPFVGNGMWVTSVEDPDGYRLEFESFTDVPEETVFSGQ